MNAVQKALFECFNERRSRNARYSLRAFSKSVGLSPAYLSMVLSGQRVMPEKRFHAIADRLGMSAFEADLVSQRRVETSEKAHLEEENFRLIANWQHLAVLNLSKLKDHKADSRWISRRLGISELEARECIQRLIGLGYLKIENGKFKPAEGSSSTTEDVPSAAIRKFHAGILSQAKQAIDEVSVSERELASIVMCVKKKDLKRMKQSLRKMHESFADAYESTAGDEVYAFSLQLFPLTKSKQENQ